MVNSKINDLEVICDITNAELPEVPKYVLEMHNLRMLYLDRNKITFLPDNLFESLPNLTWLDLRENFLETLPVTIGTHKCLENLLLQKNRITHLPKELCRVSTLTVLQLAENPIEFPPPEVIEQGLDDIMIFLQQELHKDEKKNEPSTIRSSLSSTSSSILSGTQRTESGAIKLEVLPTLLEQNLAQRVLANRQRYLDDRCSHDKVHKVIKSPSKTSVHSYFKNMSVRDKLPSQEKMDAEQIKQEWLQKLKELVSDQERILQQERTMSALKNWRNEQKSSIRQKSLLKTKEVKDLVPYDTNPAYNAYMSRADPSSEVNKALQAQMPKISKTDVDSMIKDIMSQLLTARQNVLSESNPDERVKNAEEELNLIMALHRKVSSLQKSSFS